MALTAVVQKSCIRQSSFSSHIVKMDSSFRFRHVELSTLLHQGSGLRLRSAYHTGFISQSAFVGKTTYSKSTSLCHKNSGKGARLQATFRSSNLDSDEESISIAGKQIRSSDIRILVASFTTILLAIGNKVLYKMALVPLQNYPFFLAQVTTFGYVLVYFSILFLRYKMGIVTNDMLALPKNRFVALGALEAMGLATGMAAAAVLPGASILVLHQVYLVWQLLLSYALLGKHYTWGQVGGCLLVLFGIVIVISSGGGAKVDLHHTSHFWSLLMIVSSGFAAGAAILKEFIFQDATQHAKAASVDLFVVNSFGSGFQALFVLLLLPILSRLRGIPFNKLPSYMRDGSACFFNVGNATKECNGAPLVPLLYILVNLTFNMSALNLLKMSSAIVSSLSMTLAVPFSIWMFTLPLPYLGTPSAATPGLFLGAFVLVVGLALYNISSQVRSLPAHN